MNSEINRLNTFSNWPMGAPVDPIRIAKGGFFYTGQGTEVECYSCGGKISEWNYGDQVMVRHRRIDPNCAFVVNPQMAGNEPLVLDRILTAPSATAPVSAPAMENEVVTTSSQDVGPTEEDELYKSDALRLLSFINWQDDTISREALVSAGFYHAGEGRLRCAWCGGEMAALRNLGSLGSPVDIHRRYFPRCDYALRLDNAFRTANLSPPVSAPQTPQAESPRNSVMSEGALHNSRLLSRDGLQSCDELGVVTVTGRGFQHPGMSSLSARLATYADWPAGRQQQPQALAEAGFFFTGQDDQVCCFYCDGGLGKWESGDEPWAEHARWFPGCGFVQLVKGGEFIAQQRGNRRPPPRTMSADRSLSGRQRHPSVSFPVTESQVEEQMDSQQALVALGAGLDAARVRRAIRRRIQTTGMPFTSSEALIDAVLDAQLNEESWSVNTNQRFARDILAEALREFAPAAGIIPSLDCDQRSQSESSSRSRTPNESSQNNQELEVIVARADTSQNVTDTDKVDRADRTDRAKSVEREREGTPRKKLSLEEENRQLKEARLCKVCMDSEVSVVFLPCGHLVSCARCGAALPSCPLCRTAVRALVRAYLA